MYSTTINESGALVITAGVNPLSITIYKADTNHMLSAYGETVSLEAAEEYVSASTDGFYKYNITELTVVSGFYYICYSTVKSALEEKIARVLNLQRIAEADTDKYDFMALTLLGLIYLGNDDIYTTGWIAVQTTLPELYHDMNLAILESTKYLSDFTIINKHF